MRVVSLCVAAAAASLLVQRTPDFDPTAWLIWGRQLADGTLHTTGGPSWKPLPVLFTTPFALAGDTVAPWLWLVVARTGGLLAVVLAFRLAARIGGRTAGWLAAAALALATDFLYNAARGTSEGLLVASALWAVLLHLDGRRHAALLAGTVTGLIRPEVWLVLGGYGLWLLWRDRRARTALLLGAIAAGLAAAWFVPEKVGSGDWLRAAERAQQPAPGSPGQSALPFLFVFLNSSIAVSLPVYAGAVRAVVAAWRGRAPRTLLHLAAGATLLMLVIGGLAEQGFTGNLRYVTLPAALLCVLAGPGLSLLAEDLRGVRSRALARAVLLVGALGVVFSVVLLARNVPQLLEEGRVYGRELPRVVELAGGETAVKACGTIGASHFGRQAVAYLLHVRQEEVVTGVLVARGIVFAREGTGAADESRLPVRLRHGDWVLRSSCPISPR